LFYVISSQHLLYLSAVGWASGRASSLLKTEWWGVGVVICLEWSADDLHMAHLMPLPPYPLLLR